jgi:hypothetical protein
MLILLLKLLIVQPVTGYQPLFQEKKLVKVDLNHSEMAWNRV